MRLSLLLIFFYYLLSSVLAAKNPKFCGDRFEQMRDKVCRWPGEPKPCLQLHHSIKERTRKKCCEQGCSVEELKKEMCCMTDACLRRCYPGKGYRLGSVY